MSRGSKSKVDATRSSLLNQQENDKFEDLLGRRCASMATAVAQLFMALPHSPSTWSLQHTGVVAFVKDNPQRSYFIRMFDLKVGRLVWEQELYNQLDYSTPRPFFHTFASDDCQIGLNFAEQQEAEAFQNAINEKISQRQSRHEKKQRPPQHRDRGTLPPVPSEKVSSGGPGSFHMATVDIQNPDIQASRYRSVPSPATAPVVSNKGKKDKKDKDKNKKKNTKLSKADIGAPCGFKHVSHVGWDPNNLDPDLWKLLSQAGISEDEMRDEKTSQLIYDVIEQSGGMEAVKREVNRGAGPPPPPPHSRQGPLPPVPGPGHSQAQPAPPRVRSGPLPPVPGQPQRGTPPSSRGGVPPVPPPSNRGGLPPPPAPSHFSPPPPPSLKPAASANSARPPPPPSSQQRPVGVRPPPVPSVPGRGGGGPPPPPPPPPAPPPPPLADFPPPPPPVTGSLPPPPMASSGDGRGALLDQIRHGKKLRNVPDCIDAAPPTPPESSEGIVGALMSVMQKRSKVIHSSEESEDEGGDDDDDDDEWDD